MPCPIHIWVPLLAAATPVARIVHRRLFDWREPEPSDTKPARGLRRWAPVGAARAATAGSEPAHDVETSAARAPKRRRRPRTAAS